MYYPQSFKLTRSSHHRAVLVPYTTEYHLFCTLQDLQYQYDIQNVSLLTQLWTDSTKVLQSDWILSCSRTKFFAVSVQLFVWPEWLFGWSHSYLVVQMWALLIIFVFPPPEQVAIFWGKICSFLAFSVALLVPVVSVEVCAVQHGVPTGSGNVFEV